MLSSRASTAIVFGLALSLRLIHTWQLHDTLWFSVLLGDARGYDAWAQRLAAGDWVGGEVFYQAPLYPYLLGVLYALFGHDLLLPRMVQAVLGAAGCAFLVTAGAHLFCARVGIVAGLLLACYPPAIFADGLLQKTTLDVLLMCATLALVAQLEQRGAGHGRLVALGATLGALALTRENALVLTAVLLLWTLQRFPRATAAAHTARWSPAAAILLLSGVLLVLLPVMARNYVISGELHLTTSQFGSNLYIGNHPGADGSYVSLREGRGSPEYERLDATELAEAASGRRLTPAEVSSYWSSRTWAYVREEPVAWVRLLLRKTWLFMSSTEIIDTESQESYAADSVVLRVLGPVWHFGVLLPLSVWGAMLLWPERRWLWPLYALAIAYALSVIAFFVVARYRLAITPMLMIFAASGAVTLLDALRSRQRSTNTLRAAGPRVAGVRPVSARHLPPWRVAAAGAVLAAVAANWPLYTAASQQAITDSNLGAALQEGGRLQDAILLYRRALDAQPEYLPALNNLGTALRAADQPYEALAVYDAALARDTSRASLHLNRGNALMSVGRVAEAVVSFRLARTIDQSSPQATESLARALYDLGTTDLAAGRLTPAVDALREAVRLRPTYAEAFNNLGIALASQGRLADAVAQWEQALRLAPDFADARRNLEQAKFRSSGVPKF